MHSRHPIYAKGKEVSMAQKKVGRLNWSRLRANKCQLNLRSPGRQRMA